MVIATQDRAFSQAYPDVADPIRDGSDPRSPARLPDEGRPLGASADGGEDPGLSRLGRAAPGRPGAPPPPPLTDATTDLLRAVRVRAGHYAGFVLEEIRSRRWASVTFQGARHEIVLRLEGQGAGEAAGRLLANLEARGFELRGHLVADVSLVSEERRPGFARIRLDALTVEDK
jgi:hypothetical protein